VRLTTQDQAEKPHRIKSSGRALATSRAANAPTRLVPRSLFSPAANRLALMTSPGLALRLARISDADGNFLLVPMDHGVSNGPMPGLTDPAAAVRAVVAGEASGVIVHKGLVRRVARELAGSRTGLLVHVSASTDKGERANDKVLVGSVEEAIACGADGVSAHVNLGADSEDRMLADLGHLSDACRRYSLPLLAMVYLRGPKIKDPYDADAIAHAARLAEELGADLVKVNYSGSVASFRKVVEAVEIPVLIAGGAKLDSAERFLQVACEARDAGARGISVGRNIWQAEDPQHMVTALRAIFSEGRDAAHAALLL